MTNKPHKDITGAITLITIGLVFLFNTTGLVSWDIWRYLFGFWPFILILLGIKIIVPDNKAGDIIIPTLYVLALIYVILSAYFYSVGQAVPFFSNTLNECIFNGCNLN